jgi:ankyrin repeat protein
MNYEKLRVAVSNGDFYETRRLLLEKHTDPNNEGSIRKRASVLAIACNMGFEDIANLLFEYGANISDEDLVDAVSLRNRHLSASDVEKTVEQLIRYGADVTCLNRIDAGFLKNIYHDVPLVRLLAKHGLDVNREDKETGNTFLIWAIKYRPSYIVKIYIDIGSDVNKMTPTGDTPFSEAMRLHDYESASMLLDHDANPRDVVCSSIDMNTNLDFLKRECIMIRLFMLRSGWDGENHCAFSTVKKYRIEMFVKLSYSGYLKNIPKPVIKRILNVYSKMY